MLTLALGAGTVAGAGVLATPAWAAGTISATYSLSSTAIWTGQSVTLKQDAFTDSTPDTVPAVTIEWGDGSTTETAHNADPLPHTYSAAGSYVVTVRVLDDGAETIAEIAKPAVVVTAAGGSFTFSPTWNWTGEWQGYSHEATLKLSGVPANTTRLWVNWGDGETSLVNKANASVKHRYTIDGASKWTPKVTLENPAGRVTKNAGSYTLKDDVYAPSATLKVPGSPSKASSWKTIQGTAKDSQIGMDAVGVQLWKWTSTKDYYYNFKTSKWVKYTPGVTNIPSTALKWVGVNSSGVWKVGVAGLSKGYHIEVDYVAYDKAGNSSGLKYRVQKLTS